MFPAGLCLPSKEELRETYVAAPVELPLQVLSPLEPLTVARCSFVTFQVFPQLSQGSSRPGLCARQRTQDFSLTTKRIGSLRRAPSAMDEFESCAKLLPRQEPRARWLRKELAWSGSNATLPGCTSLIDEA